MIRVEDVVLEVVRNLGIPEEEALACAIEISEELQKYYELSPGSTVNRYLGKLSKELEDMQRRVMLGEDLTQEIEMVSEELEDVAILRNLAYEDTLRLEHLRKKLAYIRTWNMVRKHVERLREKERELRNLVSDEAWDLYLDIEEMQGEFVILLAEQVMNCK